MPASLLENTKSGNENNCNYKRIVRVLVPSHIRQFFDYLVPTEINFRALQFGMRVLVPFGTRKIIGFVLETANATSIAENKLKSIISVLDKEPLWSPSIIELLKWASNYYHYPLGEMLYQVLPPFLRKNLPKGKVENDIQSMAKAINNNGCQEEGHAFSLNNDQKIAIETILKQTGFQTFLLDGVTGSGKTEVYLRVIDHYLQQGKQALVLVPEINLTPQTISRFAKRFAVPIATIHSKLNTKERFCSWWAAKEGTAPIVIGTRSAIFTPLVRPGVIIIDEEHDLSFKQQASLRYSARDLAIMRGKLENIPVVLGSATPSLETFTNAWNKRYTHLQLPKRAGDALPPQFRIVDMRNQKITEGLAAGLIQAMEKHLDNNGQILVFLNNRGYAPVLLCNSCGWNADCKNCDAHLTLHRREQKLHCHHCGAIYEIPKTCANCNKQSLYALGLGTEKLETIFPKLFPGVNLVRVDRDTTTRKGAIHKMLQSIHKGESQILIGTQMLAKGHHFPNVTMAAILNVDNGLFSQDFRASEYLAQLIMQVAGRAGREKKVGEVYIQTYNPRHPLLERLVQCGYSSFAKAALRERQEAFLPPFSFLALLRVEAKKQERAVNFLKEIKTQAQRQVQELLSGIYRDSKISNHQEAIKIFGPTTAPMERKAGFYRMQLLLQSESRQLLQKLLAQVVEYIDTLKTSGNIRWSLDVDPVEMG